MNPRKQQREQTQVNKGAAPESPQSRDRLSLLRRTRVSSLLSSPVILAVMSPSGQARGQALSREEDSTGKQGGQAGREAEARPFLPARRAVWDRL